MRKAKSRLHSLARDDTLSNSQCMLILNKRVTRSAGLLCRFQKAEQGVLAVAARGLVFHVEKMPGGLHGGEGALCHVVAEQTRIFGGQRLEPGQRAGLGPIGHMGYFRPKAKPLWDEALDWFDTLRAATPRPA